ncbi:telomere length regulation protein-domain-containing protein [Lipomyces japonicus]|uniref:telomere length regulation protein-domain-containing protein n=1 Tax=Lipomyces japonicus TaxID=56871 RepID=UPI0034CFF276
MSEFTLGSNPAIADVLLALQKMDRETKIPNQKNIKLILSVINVLPEFYYSLSQDKDSARLLKSGFTSLSSLSILVQVISQENSHLADYPSSEPGKLKLRILITFLSTLLTEGVVERVYKPVENFFGYEKEVCALFASGKLLSTLSESYVRLGDKSGSWMWITDPQKYILFLSREICLSLVAKKRPWLMKFCEQVLSLEHSHLIFTHLITPKSLFNFKGQIVRQYTDHFTWKAKIITVFLRYISIQFLNPLLDSGSVVHKRVSGSAFLMKELVESSQYSLMLNALLSETSNTSLRRSLIVWIVEQDKQMNAFDFTFKIWGDAITVNNVSVTKQKVQTEVLFLLLPYLDYTTVTEFLESADYLQSISNRLQASSSTLRFMGMSFAQAINERYSSSSLSFNDVDGFTEIYKSYSKFSELNDRVSSLKDLWENLSSSIAAEVTATPMHELSNSKPSILKIFKVDGDDESEGSDSDEDEFIPYALTSDESEDSDDDPTLIRKRIGAPVYLVDLVKYFATNDESKSYSMQKAALVHGPSLIFRKSMFGKELESNAVELTMLICGLKDNYKTEDFQNLKLHNMIALVIGSPKVAGPKLVEQVAFGDYSLQERLMILSSIALGALYLSGDRSGEFDFIKENEFSSKTLPSAAHERFIATSNLSVFDRDRGTLKVNNVIHDLQRSMISDTAPKAVSEISNNPGIIRISRKLQLEREKVSKTVTANNLIKVAGDSLFFPLVAGWPSFYRLTTRNPFSSILISQYIKCLTVILRSSFPAATNILDMSVAFYELLATVQSNTSSEVMEAYFTALMVIIDVNESELLLNRLSKHLMELHDFLQITWASIVDRNTQSLVAALIFKLSGLLKKWREMLIGNYF